MNLVILKGRLVKDVSIQQSSGGVYYCRFTLAVDGFKDKDGNKQADFIECTAWRQTAEFIGRYLCEKGQEMLIEGNLKNNNYEKDGVKHWSYVVNVNRVHFCGSKRDNQGDESNAPAQTYSQAQPQSRPAPAPQRPQAAPAQAIDVSEFEEVLSDGEVPF